MDYGLIMRWQRGTMTERVAADLASQIGKGSVSKWGSLPLNRTVAEKWDVSERTVTKAKRLLADHGVLVVDGKRFYVA
jgi:DNA-binding GntR family transcriptional regulator